MSILMMAARNKQKKQKSEFFDDSAYKNYRMKHGLHFTDKLAECMSKKMINHNGMQHTWTVADVRAAFIRLGYEKPDHVTWGDVTYMANKAYAVFFNKSIKAEIDCVTHACAMANDPNAYDGHIFGYFLSDVMGHNWDINWAEMV